MLAAGLPGALFKVGEERHPMQEVVLGHVREFFDGVVGRLGERVAEQKGALAQAEASADPAKLDDASSALTAAEAVVEERRKVLHSAQQGFAEAADELQKARASSKGIVKEKTFAEKELAHVKAIEDDGLKPLTEGVSPNEKEAKKAADKLVRDLGKLGAEPTLLASAHQVLLKPPSERKGFDAIVIKSLTELLTERKEAASKQLADQEAALSELNVDITAKEAVVEKARGERDEEVKRLEAADVERTNRLDLKQALEKEAEQKSHVVAERIAALQRAEAEVARVEALRGTFELLVSAEQAPAVTAAEEGEAAPSATAAS